MNVEELIKNLKDGDNIKANNNFKTVMADKLHAALEAEKVRVASTTMLRDSDEDKEAKNDEVNN